MFFLWHHGVCLYWLLWFSPQHPTLMIAGDTKVWKQISSIQMVLSCSGPAAHSFKDRTWEERTERMEGLCVLKDFDFLKSRLSACREGALKAQHGWVGWVLHVQPQWASPALDPEAACGHLSIWRISVSGEPLFPEPVFGKGVWGCPSSFGVSIGNDGEFANPEPCFLQTVAAVRLLLVTRDSSQLANTSLEEKNSLTSPHTQRERKRSPLMWTPEPTP